MGRNISILEEVETEHGSLYVQIAQTGSGEPRGSLSFDNSAIGFQIWLTLEDLVQLSQAAAKAVASYGKGDE